MRRALPLALLLSLTLVAGCGGSNQASVVQDPSQDFHDGGALAIQGFNTTGEYVAVDGEWVMMFNYPDEGAAAADQAAIAPDGKSINGQPLTWDGPVHLFRRGRFIAVYVGSQLSVLDKLNAGGGQFAGD